MKIDDAGLLMRLLHLKEEIKSIKLFQRELKAITANSADEEEIKAAQLLIVRCGRQLHAVGSKMEPMKKALSKEFWDEHKYDWSDL